MTNIFTEKFPFTFIDPYELIVFYDEGMLEGKTRPYKWQIDAWRAFAKDRNSDEIVNCCLRAANGSGKSAFILAPCIVWMSMSFDNCLSYVTSASANQLDSQTERYLDYMIDKVNSRHSPDFGYNIWDRVKRRKMFLPTSSPVDLIATDEGTKVEGKHPLIPDAEFGIFIDEGKAILPEIYEGLSRCTGYTRKFNVSSPGTCFGEFYDICTKDFGYVKFVVTAADCPHIRKTEIDQLIKKHGVNDPLVRSAIFAEFTSTDAQLVIPREVLMRCRETWDNSKGNLFTGPRAGLDLSGGGDENVLSIWKGNQLIHQYSFRVNDTTRTAEMIYERLKDYSVPAAMVWADDGGVGKGIIDMLARVDYNVNRVWFGGRPYDTTRYGNRGTEMWFNIKRFVEEGIIDIGADEQLFEQLANRYYKTSISGKHQLESKHEAKANGHPSPDRADASVLAWSAYPFSEFIDTVKFEVKDRPSTSLQPNYSDPALMSRFIQNYEHLVYTGENLFASREPDDQPSICYNLDAIVRSQVNLTQREKYHYATK